MKRIDMTEGKVLQGMVQFAIPLMLGDLFQQLYIATDSAILGQFAGADALAAVGVTTFLIRLIIGLFVGISAGASVVIAQSAGAKDFEKLEDAIHTMAGLTIYGGIFLTLMGIGVARPLLHMVSTPADIMDQTTIYLKIYFMGSFAELVYNVGSGILRSFGDSKRPFIYLVISSLINIILDLVFIGGLHMGIKGAALATVIAQIVSAILIVYAMIKTKEPYRLKIGKIKVDRNLVPEILKMGLPAGIQGVIVAVSNVIVQANINEAGTAAVAGFGVFNRVDGVIMLPISAIAVAAMTFTGQNYGAGHKRRIVSGIRAMFILEAAAWIIGVVICLIFGNSLFYLFTDNKEVVDYAKKTMLWCIPGYGMMASGYAMTCIIRGMGRSRAASIIYIANMCGMRQLWILFVNWKHMGLDGILMSYPVSWILTLAGTLLYTLYLKKLGEFDENTDKRECLLRIS